MKTTLTLQTLALALAAAAALPGAAWAGNGQADADPPAQNAEPDLPTPVHDAEDTAHFGFDDDDPVVFFVTGGGFTDPMPVDWPPADPGDGTDD